ncbi:ANL family adenylate-forming protein [Flavobacterium hydatis]|nr:fatty acid--CoA ligase family protein [Flavobacterium hydatis]
MFYINEKEAIFFSYEDLVSHLNEFKSVVTNPYKTTTLDLFLNLIKALIHNKDVTLLDQDFTDSEIVSLVGEKYTENIAHVEGLGLDYFNSYLKLITESKSLITIYTSGTTGLPKKVVHTVSSLSREIKTGTKFDASIWGLTFNPSHMAGLQVFFQALFNGNTLVDLSNMNSATINQLILKHEISHISATPTFYRLLNSKDIVFNNVKSVTLGGEKSDDTLYNIVKRMFPFAKIKNIYASTEAGALLSSEDDFFYIPERLKSKIVVIENVLYIHESLLGQMPNRLIENGWYCSGDVIEWKSDSDYYFKLIGKSNEMINVGGYKVNPHEVESELRSIDGIDNVFVFGKANSVIGNLICAEIVLEKGAEIEETKIKDILRMKLQQFKIPRRIFFVDKLNLNRTGKISRVNATR